LVSDGHAIDNESDLIVSAPRVNRAVGVLSEARKGEENGFQPAIANLERETLDIALVHLGIGTSLGRVNQGGGVTGGHNEGGLRGSEFEAGVDPMRDIVTKGDELAKRVEAVAGDDEFVSLEREIGKAELPGGVGEGDTLEMIEALEETNFGSGDKIA
jgi:hypothetical protein